MLQQGTFLQARPALQQGVSPQLVIQSHILELNADELAERISQELADNPALEVAEEAEYLRLPSRVPAIPLASTDLADYVATPQTLAEDLRLQLLTVPQPRRRVCEYLVECLDERGFLDMDGREVAAACGVTPFEAEAAITTLQDLEPAGIGARSLRECLLLQVRRLPAAEAPAGVAAFINTYLSTVRRRSPTQAAQVLDLTDHQLARILEFIGQHLYMWPADRYRDLAAPEVAPSVVPDAWITQTPAGLQVQVNQSWSRSVRVSDAYARLDEDWRRATGALGLEERERLADKVRTARTFIHYLTRRETVLKRVTEAIVRRQRDFFLQGPTALEPLTRKELAASLRLHESTISRITRGKYVQLPDERLVPYDFFFDNSLPAKTELRELIAAEDPAHPLSDGALAAMMQTRGYPLARRTVAKYRDSLGLAPAHQRRRRTSAAPATPTRHVLRAS